VFLISDFIKIIMSDNCHTHCFNCDFKSDAFKTLSELEMQLIDSKRVVLNYRKGEVVGKQGAFVTHILFVKQGLVKIYKELNGKDNLILNFYPAGQLIGLPSIFSGDILQYSVAAVEDSVICAIDKSVIETLILENGNFAASIIRSINTCTNFHFDKIFTLTQKQMNGRLAEALLFLSKNIFKSDCLAKTLTRKDLAEFTGMSVMSVVRGIKDFKLSGLIDDKEGVIKIVNKTKLEHISATG
jgi:CRP/FNR family transcriptional regulator, polysaccharide utilization system transcription regulator